MTRLIAPKMLFDWDSSSGSSDVGCRLLSDEQSESRNPRFLVEPMGAGHVAFDFHEVTDGDERGFHHELEMFIDSTEISDDVERRFLALAVLWKYGQGPSSSLADMISHPAYLQIIGLGRNVLPFLFQELAREPDHWFSALSAITGHDPVPPNANGNVARMTEVWLRWGQRHGYI